MNKTKKVAEGVSMVFATLVLLGGVFMVFFPGILPEQKSEKIVLLAFSVEKQAEKEESVDLKKQLKTALELLEILDRRENAGEDNLAFNESTRYCLEEIIANLRARIDSARDAP